MRAIPSPLTLVILVIAVVAAANLFPSGGFAHQLSDRHSTDETYVAPGVNYIDQKSMLFMLRLDQREVNAMSDCPGARTAVRTAKQSYAAIADQMDPTQLILHALPRTLK